MQANNQGSLISRIIFGCLVSALGFALVIILGERVFSLATVQTPSWQLFL